MSERETRARVRERTRKVWEGSRYASVGIEFGLSVVIGYLAGRWLEGRFDCPPWGTVGGILLGFAAALRSLLRLAAREERRAREERSKAKNSPESGSKEER